MSEPDCFDADDPDMECEECGILLPPWLYGPICPTCDYDNHFEGW